MASLYRDVAIYDHLTEGDYRKEALICSYIWALSEKRAKEAPHEASQPSSGCSEDFKRTAQRLFRWAIRDTDSGKINAQQVTEAIRSNYDLRMRLGIPEKARWGFVMGYIHALPANVSVGEFTSRLGRLRYALLEQAAEDDAAAFPEFYPSQALVAAKPTTGSDSLPETKSQPKSSVRDNTTSPPRWNHTIQVSQYDMGPIPPVPGLCEELRALYDFYCWCGNRLNIGASCKGLKRSSFHEMLLDAGLVGQNAFISKAHVDCVLESRIGRGVVYISFPAFLESLCAIAARLRASRSWKANTYVVLVRFLLPMAAVHASYRAKKAFRVMERREVSPMSKGKARCSEDYNVPEEIGYWIDRLTCIKGVEDTLMKFETQQLFEFTDNISDNPLNFTPDNASTDLTSTSVFIDSTAPFLSRTTMELRDPEVD